MATGVSSAAADVTATDISTVFGEMPMPWAAVSAIGITISAVAMLLINWPSTAVRTNNPASSAYGPPSPTNPTRPSASNLAAPVSIIAVESAIMPPTSTTVFQAMLR